MRQAVSSAAAEEKSKSALSKTATSLPPSPCVQHHLCLCPESFQKRDALPCFCVLLLRRASIVFVRFGTKKKIHILHPASSSPDSRSLTMTRTLLFYGVLGAVLLLANCDKIRVCIEDDRDLRVDCLVEPKPSRINSYEFSWSSGNKEAVINTNVSGAASEARFRDKSYVEELEPHGYRLTLTGFTDTLPHNTTYMCKISGNSATITIERDLLLPCSAVSVILKTSGIWVMGLLIFLQQMHC